VRSKREIVLLSAAALAAAYGLYVIVFAPKRPAGAAKDPGTPPPVPASAALATASEIARVQQEIGRTAVSPLVRLTALRAAEEWRDAVFLSAALPAELKERELAGIQQQQAAQAAQLAAESAREAAEELERQRLAERRQRFVYSGYANSDGRTYAVINGAVYEVGERLDLIPGCSLKAITPESVAIEDQDRGITLDIPMRQDPLRDHDRSARPAGP
jgi:hypothetical protein